MILHIRNNTMNKELFEKLRERGHFAVSNSQERDLKIWNTAWKESIKYIKKELLKTIDKSNLD